MTDDSPKISRGAWAVITFWSVIDLVVGGTYLWGGDVVAAIMMVLLLIFLSFLIYVGFSE